MRQRPIGVTILAILAIITGLIGLMGGCLLTGFGSIVGPIGAIFGGGQLGASAFAAGCGSLIGAVVWLAVGIGTWRLQPWAWILGLIGVAISVVSHVLGLLQGESLFIGLLSLALPVIILIYLLSPGVRQAFGRG
jgi:hypothetical protein